MASKECIAMLLAGGQGSRLMALTSKIAKPAVSFGGKFRIIDFSLSNCANSGIDTVGVLTQYRPYQLHQYVGSGRAWDLAEHGAGVSILPPYATQDGGAWYAGTADAITQNLDYIKGHDPSTYSSSRATTCIAWTIAKCSKAISSMAPTSPSRSSPSRGRRPVASASSPPTRTMGASRSSLKSRGARLEPRLHGHLHLLDGRSGKGPRGGCRRPAFQP